MIDGEDILIALILIAAALLNGELDRKSAEVARRSVIMDCDR